MIIGEEKVGVMLEGGYATYGISLEEFDRAVELIVDQEFVGVLDMGLVSEETLFPLVAGMCSALHEAFPAMSGAEAEFHLRQLRRECRETANSIIALAETEYWN